MNEELRLYNAVSQARRAIRAGASPRSACADAAAYWDVHPDAVGDYARVAERVCEDSRETLNE